MWRQVKAASISAVLLAATAGIASAQGSITQDPGSQAPRNLTLQYLGPSDAGVTIPGEPDTSGGWRPLGAPTGRGRVGAMPGYGSSTTGAGSGTGNRGGYGTSPLGGNR
jgi:hypothetical protein